MTLARSVRCRTVHGTHTGAVRAHCAVAAEAAGHVRLSNHPVLHAILYVAEHGVQWRDLPERFGHGHTVYTRRNRWSKNGVLDRVFLSLKREQRIRVEAMGIDRIHAALTSRPKLLIPDIKGEAHIVYEDGRLYPHHNLYFITSDEWDLRALRTVLRSGIARLFVSTYATRMRGGYFRFQAQYLRRIRLPRWQEVAPSLRDDLIEMDPDENPEACRRMVSEIYGLTRKESAAIGKREDRGANGN